MKTSAILKRIFPLVILLLSISAFSQDTIVTNTNDTIFCKITKISENEISFNLTQMDDVKKMKLVKSSILKYTINQNATSRSSIPSFFQYRLAFNGGFSYRTSPYEKGISNEDKAYISELRKAVHFGTELMYYPFDKFGLGLKYCYMGTQKAPIYIHSLAIKADYRLASENQKHFLHIYGSGGYLSYIEHLSQDGVVRVTAGTLGLSCGVGYDFLIKNRFAIGMDIAYVLGGLSSIKVSNGYDSATIDLKENPAGLNRIDLSLGVRFIR